MVHVVTHPFFTKSEFMFKGRDGKTIYLDMIEIDCYTTLNWKDRIRLIFGSRIGVKFEVLTQRNFGKFESRSIFMIESLFKRSKAFDPPKAIEECPEPQKA